MSEEQPTQAEQPQSQTEQPAASANWREVGDQFERLGKSLAEALRATFTEAEHTAQWDRVRTSLESAAREVGQAVEDTAKSPKGQEFKEDAQRAVDQLRTAGEQTVQDARPHLATALRQMNVELQKLIEWADREKKE